VTDGLCGPVRYWKPAYLFPLDMSLGHGPSVDISIILGRPPMGFLPLSPLARPRTCMSNGTHGPHSEP